MAALWNESEGDVTRIDIGTAITNPLLDEQEREELSDSEDFPEESSLFSKLAVACTALLLGIVSGLLAACIVDATLPMLGLSPVCGGLLPALTKAMQRALHLAPLGPQPSLEYQKELLARGISVNAVQAGQEPAPVTAPGEHLYERRWADAHNHFRSAHYNDSMLVWDSELASAAQAWADELKSSTNCEARYSLREGLGENMYWGAYGVGQPAFLPWEVVSAWAAQRGHYNYESNSCAQGMECSSYLQVVWKESTKFGCGEATCDYTGVFQGRQTVLLCYYMTGAPFTAPLFGSKPY